MGKTINIGLVGIGRAGYGMHVAELESRKDKFCFVATCDLLPERMEMMEKELGTKSYSTIEELVQAPDVDIVAIATRSCDHFAHAMIALEAGKDVLVEKPMCITSEEAHILCEIANDPTKPNIYTRFNRRFEEHFNKIKDAMEEGKLGEVIEIRIARNGFSRRDDWQMLQEFGGGNLYNWGPHLVDQALVLIDAPVTSVWSNLQHTIGAGDAEDHVDVILTGENGRVAKLEISNDHAFPTPHYEIYGTRGAAVYKEDKLFFKYIDPEQQFTEVEADPGTPGQKFGTTGTYKAKEEFRWITEEIECGCGDITGIWDSLYESMVNGAEYPIKMEHAVRVIEVMYEALSKGVFTHKM